MVAPRTARTASAAARSALGRARAFEPGSPRSTTSCSGGVAPTTRSSASPRTSCSYRATDPEILEVGQDGGLVSALLVYALEHDVIDAALVSYLEGDGSSWKAVPGVARNRADVVRSAGSRYTYSANPLAYGEATSAGAERLALVGMSCQASMPAMLTARRAGKVARRFTLTIGLLCSKTFDDAIFAELFEARYGLVRSEIVKMNIKGVVQIWMRDGSYHEVPLAEAHDYTREGLQVVPGLRRRARGHLDWRDRRVRGLHLDHRAHREGTRAAAGDARRRGDRDPAGERRSRCARAAASTVEGEPPPLARRSADGGRRGSPVSGRLIPGVVQSSSRVACASTASNISAVSSPVKTLRWLGWYEQRSDRPFDPPRVGDLEAVGESGPCDPS